jgi:hypothetical protein
MGMSRLNWTKEHKVFIHRSQVSLDRVQVRALRAPSAHCVTGAVEIQTFSASVKRNKILENSVPLEMSYL